jgi:hypothetical protein
MSKTATPVTFGRADSMYLWSVAKYQQLIDVGIVTPED